MARRENRVRGAITALFRLFMNVFFRRVELVGEEHVPPHEPVIFAVNHPNGLVDPLFLICYMPRPVSFLAKAPLFRYPVIGWFVRAFESIPVYRKQDNTRGSNEETFSRAREVLQRGGSIAIFPEGTTHSDPQLRELKTGAARIALGAGLARMSIVPAGIYYTAKHIFRSSALVVFGEPIRVQPSADPSFEEAEALTTRIDEGLDRVTLQADSHAALELVARAEAIFSAGASRPLADEFDVRRRFVEGYHYLAERDPARLARLQSAVTQFEAELGGIEVDELEPRVDVKRLLVRLILLPLALLGAIVNYPTYRLVGFLAKVFSKDADEMVATMKFLGALLLFPLTYLAIATVLWLRVSPLFAILTLVALPILGWIALRVFEDLDDVIGALRALGRGERERLIARRDAMRREFVEIARELDLRP
jgi:glycerol-3-phosphate O-acyltransferase/dihydroxyacetone phosphate acyltransferase